MEGLVPRTPKEAPRPLPVGTRLSHVHIPKTAGSSFLVDGVQFLPTGVHLTGNHERSLKFTETIMSEMDPVTFLRNPVQQVLSQFLECKYDEDWGRWLTRDTAFPAGNHSQPFDGLEEWTEHFVTSEGLAKEFFSPREHAFRCYNPWNMQARYLASDAPNNTSWEDMHYVHTEGDRRPDLGEALLGMSRMPFVGISDLYIPSLCLLRFHATGTVPPECGCKIHHHLQLNHIEHSVPPHSIDDVPLRVLKRIHRLVEVDTRLFLETLRLFEIRAEIAAQATGVQLLCGGSVSGLRRGLEWIVEAAERGRQHLSGQSSPSRAYSHSLAGNNHIL